MASQMPRGISREIWRTVQISWLGGRGSRRLGPFFWRAKKKKNADQDTKGGSPYRRQVVDFLSEEPLGVSGFLNYAEETRIVPHDDIRAATLDVIEADQRADVRAEIEAIALQCINLRRYCCYVRPHFATSRVISSDHEHGRVAAHVKKAYLELKNIRGSKELKST